MAYMTRAKSVALALTCGASIAGSAAPAFAGTEKVLYSFAGGTDGITPLGLINVGANLYGMTSAGGTESDGTLFSLNLTTNAKKTLHSFTGNPDGAVPNSSLIRVGNTLYATTYQGGTNCGLYQTGCGTVFSINDKTGAEAAIPLTAAFFPSSQLSDIGGTLYGATASGGTSNVGAIFGLNLKTGVQTTIYSSPFNGDSGIAATSLINVGGILYGTSIFGGDAGGGSVFSVNPATGTFTTLYSFKGGTDGSGPYAGLINIGDTLYGTTTYGGTTSTCTSNPCGPGTVFSLNLKTGVEKILHAFGAAGDGQTPYGPLINVGSTLYGTTEDGGAPGACSLNSNGCGTLFSVDATTGAETLLHSFAAGKDGAFPVTGLINVKGTLYGTTPIGGTYNYGTVYQYTP